ncbi:metallophosphoesterase [Sphingosinicella sp.]|uniref:metallophosphoesterase n=1 Tax=Sphingosinicella sp. TaxID=1917971 RepID=UPI0040377E2F
MWAWARHWIDATLLLLLVLASPAPATPRIVAVGDLHGDHRAFVAILRAARLIDARDHWIGGDAIFVQTGDVTDRGPDSLRIIRDLIRLQRESQGAGGRVVALVGNHEAMNLTGDLRYVHPGEYAAFATRDSRRRRDRFYERNRGAIETHYRDRDARLTGGQIRDRFERETPLGQIEHRAAWAPTGEIGRWVASNPAVALIDGNLFAHGGIGVAYANLSVDEINRRATEALHANAQGRDAIINDPRGPLWYRGLIRRDADTEAPPATAVAEAPPPSMEEEITAVLAAFGARRMIVGHTPNLAGIQFLHGGRLIAIDTGISARYGGPRTYLEIVNGEATAHVVPGGAAR